MQEDAHQFLKMEIKNKIKPYAVCIAVLLILVCGILIFAEYSKTKPAGSTISVLFIGNSLTSVNDLPKTVADIAKSLGDTVNYDAYDPGSYTFKQDTTDQTALGKIRSQSWNFVVLQEQSEMPALQDLRVDNEVLPYALDLNTDIHNANPAAKTVFYETWGYQNGDSQYCRSTPTLCNYAVMQDQLIKSYSMLVQKTGGLLAPVGQAWQKVRQAHPEINLYADDRHPTPAGTYLAACVFYITLFNKPVIGASPLTLDKSQAKILQQIAGQTVLEK
jgi:hypothetical protein